MKKICEYICENCKTTWYKTDYPGNSAYGDGSFCPNCEGKNIIVVESKNGSYDIYEKNYSIK